MEDLSANLGFTHSQVKQRIKLICLSRATRTSSLSFRNHMDHKLRVSLAFFFFFFLRRTGITRNLENGLSVFPTLIWERALPILRTRSDLRSWSVLSSDLLHTACSCSQTCQSDCTWCHSLTWFCQNNLFFVANYQRTIGKEWKKKVPFCWILLL